MNMFVFMPSMMVSLFIIQYARKNGQKEALLFSTYGGIIFTVLILLLFVFGDPMTLSFVNWSVFTILFLVFLAFRGGFMSVNNSLLIPMVADCVDYEVAKTGRYLPGMIGAMFSLADKAVTSLNTIIIGALVMLAGFRDAFPTIDTPYTRALFWVGIICYCILPIFGWLINIGCLRYYNLTKEQMAEIQKKREQLAV